MSACKKWRSREIEREQVREREREQVGKREHAERESAGDSHKYLCLQ